MVTSTHRNLGLILAMLVIGTAVPLVWYWLVLGRAPSVSAAAARRLVEARDGVLVDVGVAPELAGNLTEAARWPAASILKVNHVGDVPPEMRGKKLLLICNAGVRSAAAALHLRERGVADAVSVRGGAQEYLSAVHGCSLGVLRYGDAATDAAIPAFHKSPMYEQWAAVGTFFGVKFIYSLIAAGIAIWLWRRREVDLSAIRWSMIIFFVGEACCFVNVVVFFEDSMLLEHLHSVGMVWSLGCAAYALLEGLDTRVIHFSDDSRCAAAGLCRLCAKHAEVGCGLRRLFLLLIPAMALTAALPLFSAYRVGAYNTRILGVLHSYRHPIVHQFYELRYLPVVAIVLLAVCLVVLGLEERRSISRSKILFAAALGAMGFSFFRLVLVAAFVDNQVWFAAWEETTELLFVGVIAGVLILFARGLAVEEQPIENGKRT